MSFCPHRLPSCLTPFKSEETDLEDYANFHKKPNHRRHISRIASSTSSQDTSQSARLSLKERPKPYSPIYKLELFH